MYFYEATIFKFKKNYILYHFLKLYIYQVCSNPMFLVPLLPDEHPRAMIWLGQVTRVVPEDDSIPHHLECQLPSTQGIIS